MTVTTIGDCDLCGERGRYRDGCTGLGPIRHALHRPATGARCADPIRSPPMPPTDPTTTTPDRAGEPQTEREAVRLYPDLGPRRRLHIEYAPTVAVREVIEVQFRRGSGDDESDPVRVVTAYHDLDGTLLAEFDPSKGTIR